MSKPRPQFRKENLIYEREEREGYWTFISKFHPEARELIINFTAKEILQLCDGSKTLDEIEDIMKGRYSLVEQKKIKIDIAKILATCSRLGIIEWIGGDNPYLFLKKEPISDELSMRVGQEYDIKLIEGFVNSSDIWEKEMYNYDLENFLYKSPFTIKEEYQEIALRQRLFGYVSEFFIVERRNKICGLAEIMRPLLPKSTTATLKLIIVPRVLSNSLLKYSQENYPILAVATDITKIQLLEPLKNPIERELKNSLIKMGYNEEGILYNECGFGNRVRIFGYSYPKEFIELCKK